LNDVRPISPTSRPPSSLSGPLTAPIIRHSPSVSALSLRPPPPTSHGYHYTPPSTAPAHPASFDNRGSFLREQQRTTSTGDSLHPARPGVFRRHSGHPYDIPSSSRPTSSYTPPRMQMEELSVATGSRAPISRTTKACNACRSRKVRCDAGGVTSGEPTTCGRCREGGIACVYSGPQKKRGPCPGYVRPYGFLINELMA
jgi:hypothetical protein